MCACAASTRLTRPRTPTAMSISISRTSAPASQAVIWRSVSAASAQARGRAGSGRQRTHHHLSRSHRNTRSWWRRSSRPGSARSWRWSRSARGSSPPKGCSTRRRKQRLPFLPDVIGVVTSPTGAVIRDILHRLAARFPRHVIVWPVRVQGEGSAEEVAAAIHGFNALPARRAAGPTSSSSRAAAARSRICGRSTRRSWCGRRPPAQSRSFRRSAMRPT